MKIPRIWLGPIALISFAGCAAHQPTTSAAKMDAAIQEMNRLSEIIKATDCMEIPGPMPLILLRDGTVEDPKKDYFTYYFESILGAKREQEQLACLNENPKVERFAEKHSKAELSLKEYQARIEKYSAFFPPEKQITDVEESPSNWGPGGRRVAITFRDGTQTVSDKGPEIAISSK